MRLGSRLHESSARLSDLFPRSAGRLAGSDKTDCSSIRGPRRRVSYFCAISPSATGGDRTARSACQPLSFVDRARFVRFGRYGISSAICGVDRLGRSDSLPFSVAVCRSAAPDHKTEDSVGDDLSLGYRPAALAGRRVRAVDATYVEIDGCDRGDLAGLCQNESCAFQ